VCVAVYVTFSHSCLCHICAIFVVRTDAVAWKLILYFFALQLFLMKAMPGKEFKATVSPRGNVPVYKANGMACYAFTCILLVVCTHFIDGFRPAIVYDKFPEILSSLNIFALLLCAFLYVKGWTFPSSDDVYSCGDIITDYYWGMELYVRDAHVRTKGRASKANLI